MRIAKIKENDIVNGIGITVSVFTQGCPHACIGCFNVETWDYEGGYLYTENTKTEIFELLDKLQVKRNLAILGGEPLIYENLEELLDLLKAFKDAFPNRLVFLWTGYIYENLHSKQMSVLNFVDYLIDGPFIENLKDVTLYLRGSSNQRIIDVKSTLKNNEIKTVDFGSL